MAPCLGPLPLPLPLPLASPPLARCLFSLASSAQHTHPVQAPLLPPRRYMVAMGIKGYNNEGLSSQAWKNQSPQGGWQGFFAGSSNIIFTFGAHLLGLGWEGHLGSMGYCLLGTGHCYLWLEILICPPPLPRRWPRHVARGDGQHVQAIQIPQGLLLEVGHEEPMQWMLLIRPLHPTDG